jgi:hypothetical protein
VEITCRKRLIRVFGPVIRLAQIANDAGRADSRDHSHNPRMRVIARADGRIAGSEGLLFIVASIQDRDLVGIGSYVPRDQF